MCQVKCSVEKGLIPAEKVVRFETIDGRREEVAIASSLVGAAGSFQAAEIGRDKRGVLIELPRESASGHWRAWVDESLILEA